MLPDFFQLLRRCWRAFPKTHELPHRSLAVRELGTIEYSEALELQAHLIRERREATIPDTILLLEHPHVITLGSSSDYAHVLLDAGELEKRGIALFEVGREVT